MTSLGSAKPRSEFRPGSCPCVLLYWVTFVLLEQGTVGKAYQGEGVTSLTRPATSGAERIELSQ